MTGASTWSISPWASTDMRPGSHMAYAAAAMPMAMLGLPLYVYVPPLYAQQSALGLGMVGLALMLSRLLDLVTDPLVGHYADRWRSRLHPFSIMVLGAPVMLTGVWWLFAPPPDAGMVYLLVSVGLTYAGWTLVSVPYYAWGVELGRSAADRRHIAAWREGGVIVGTLLALGLPALFAAGRQLTAMRGVLLVLLPLALFVLWRFLPRESLRRAGSNRFGLRRLWRNTEPVMRRLLWLHLINAMAAGIPATLFVFYTDRVIGLDMSGGALLLLVYFLAAIAALPLWTLLARRIGELRAWRAAMLIAAIGFLPAALLAEGDAAWFVLVCVVTGSTLGADIALPAAVQARLAERATNRSSAAAAGTAFGLWGMAGKLALALAAGLALPLLDYSSELVGAAATLPVLYALLPVLFKLLAIQQLQVSMPALTAAMASEPQYEAAPPSSDHRADGKLLRACSRAEASERC